MTDPTRYPSDLSNENSAISSPLLPIDLSVDYCLNYTNDNSSNSVFTTNNNNNEEPEDIQEVLDALLDLHDLRNIDPAHFEADYLTILKAINLNDELQNKAEDQIRLVEEQLETNARLMKEASLSTLEENRFGNKFPIHTLYRDPINYFQDDELLKLSKPNNVNANKENQFELEEDEEDFTEEEEDEDDEEEENVKNSADNENNRSHRAWSRTERERLEDGIVSEAKRMISFDFVIKKEEWRIWEVDKMEKKELLMFPVSRIEWDRISNLHVLTRSPIECLIQWTTQEHPTINKKPWSKQESQKLSNIVNEIGLFSGQWERIANELGTNRTISQCFSHYMYEKNNSYARSLKWSKEEDQKLTDAVKLFGNCNWQQVADILGERTGQQCLHRWQKSLNPVIKRQRWNTEEDTLLERAVHLYGAGNWTKIQRLIPGRTDMQCRERWVNILQPSINRGQFTQEETKHLMELVAIYGTKWSYLQTLMPGRTDNALMRHYKTTTKAAERKDKNAKAQLAKEKAKQTKKPPKKQKKSTTRQAKITGEKAPKKRSKDEDPADELDGEEQQNVISKRPKIDGSGPLRRSTRARNNPTIYNVDDDIDSLPE